MINFNFRCPRANKWYNANEKKKIFDHLDFKEQIITGLKYMKLLQDFLLLISANTFSNINKEPLKNLINSVIEVPLLYYFLMDELDRMY